MNTLFNAQAALLFDEPEYPPFVVEETMLLSEALAEKRLEANTRLLLVLLGNKAIALPVLAMVYHHVAQGKSGDLDWLASFCALCNAGSVFNARVEGQLYHFASQGYYDAMSLLADQESQSYWNHLTGTALHGALAGQKLEQLGSLLEMTASDIVNAYPQARLALDTLNADDKAETAAWEQAERLSPEPTWEEDVEIRQSLVDEDKRLPRHEMGLGIWTEKTKRYYPIRQLYQAQNLLLDELDGRTILIYIDPHVGLPMAFFCEAKTAEWHGEDIHLAGKQLKKAVLYENGKALTMERPRQNAMRWHGFSALFPDCEIYGL